MRRAPASWRFGAQGRRAAAAAAPPPARAGGGRCAPLFCVALASVLAGALLGTAALGDAHAARVAASVRARVETIVARAAAYGAPAVRGAAAFATRGAAAAAMPPPLPPTRTADAGAAYLAEPAAARGDALGMAVITAAEAPAEASAEAPAEAAAEAAAEAPAEAAAEAAAGAPTEAAAEAAPETEAEAAAEVAAGAPESPELAPAPAPEPAPAAAPALGALPDDDASGAAAPPACAWAAAAAAPEASFSWSEPGNLSAAPAVGGAAALHVAGCDLGWSRAAARQCLARLGHVVFAGDSVTRLQFISLVHWLHTGLWAPADGRPPGDSPRHWGVPAADGGVAIDFPAYFAAVAARLGGAEVCDCAIGAKHVENRYYADGALRLSYVSLFKRGRDAALHEPRWLNVSCGAARCAQAGCAPGRCDEPARALVLPGARLAAALPRLLRPDVLVLNVGVHEEVSARAEPAAAALYARVAAEMREVARAGGGRPRADADLAAAWDEERARGDAAAPPEAPAAPPAAPPAARAPGPFRGLVWKVTTPGKEAAAAVAGIAPDAAAPPAGPVGAPLAPPPAPWPRADAEVAAAVAAAGGAIFDAHAILYPLVVPLALAGRGAAAFAHAHDAWHFAPAVNAELNKALLSMLCEGVAGA